MNKQRWHCLFPVFIIAILSMITPPKKITVFMAGDSTMAIKETKAFPETGWGMPFTYFFDSSVTIVNTAKNGRSTKTFISEGLWSSIIDNAKEGDYVFIEFGHNDESKEKTERYTTPEQYTTNILRFIHETQAKRAIPILLTPVSRRKFDSSGKIMETHEIYSGLVRKIAADTKVWFIDLDSLSMELYQKFGKEDSKWLFMQLRPGEHPNYPEGRDDNTHFTELGARLIAELVLADMRRQNIPLMSDIYIPVKK